MKLKETLNTANGDIANWTGLLAKCEKTRKEKEAFERYNLNLEVNIIDLLDKIKLEIISVNTNEGR